MVNELDPKLVAKAKERLTKIVVMVMQHKHTSWIARKFLAKTPIFTMDIPTACTDGFDIYINPVFWSELTNKQMLFVLVHEGLHMLLMHCNAHYLKKIHKYIHNVAADANINAVLLMNQIGEPLPDGINPFDGTFDYNVNGVKLKITDCNKKSVHDIYKEIMKHVKEYPGKGDGEGEFPADIKDSKGKKHSPHGDMKLKPFTAEEEVQWAAEQAAWTTGARDRHNAEAKRQRAAAYVAETDSLFFKSQRGEVTVQEWQNKIVEIKARFPYQE